MSVCYRTQHKNTPWIWPSTPTTSSPCKKDARHSNKIIKSWGRSLRHWKSWRWTGLSSWEIGRNKIWKTWRTTSNCLRCRTTALHLTTTSKSTYQFTLKSRWQRLWCRCWVAESDADLNFTILIKILWLCLKCSHLYKDKGFSNFWLNLIFKTNVC